MISKPGPFFLSLNILTERCGFQRRGGSVVEVEESMAKHIASGMGSQGVAMIGS